MLDDSATVTTQPSAGAGTARLATADGRTPRPASFPTTAPVEPLLNRMPPIAHVDKTLPNGLRVVVVPDHRVPFVRITLGLKFGSFSEDPAKAGAASMAARLITHGTKNYSAEKWRRSSNCTPSRWTATRRWTSLKSRRTA